MAPKVSSAPSARACNGRFPGNNPGRPTFKRHGQATVIDYILTSVEIWHNVVDFSAEERSESDHNPLVVELDFQCGGLEPRGKQNTGTESAGEPPLTQSSSTEDPAAVPSAEPLPSTSADGDSGAASAIPAGTGGTEAPTPAAVGGEPTAAGDVTPSQKPTRKELAVRARQRKLQAIVEAYRRLVDQAEEEEEEAAAAAAASSNAPGPKPAGLRRRGQAATRRRVVTSSAAPPQQQQHACKCRCRDFQAKILRRVASKLEEERKKLEDGLEERVKIMVDKHLKARRL
ncbi:uncharacterized protein LOC144769371 [Lissotriton helveticus]